MATITKKIYVAEISFVEDGGKYRLSSEDATLQRWIATRKTQRVALRDIPFVVEAAEKFIRTGVAEGKGRKLPEEISSQHPIVALVEKCNAKWRRPIMTGVVDVRGAEHRPTVEVFIKLPNGKEFFASGGNQKVAKSIAAKDALKYLAAVFQI